jgi:two-component system, chemotaxis family, sensor kinase CheA
MDRHTETFRQEGFELLGTIEETALSLERGSGNPESVGRLFRAAHTLKGSGAMFGFGALAALAHDMETALEQVREGKRGWNRRLTDLCLEACDRFRELLDETAPREEADAPESTLRLAAAFRELAEAEPARILRTDLESVPASVPSGSRPRGGSSDFWIRFRPRPDVFRLGMNPAAILLRLSRMGRSRVVASVEAMPGFDVMDPESCYLGWDVLLSTRSDESDIRDVFLFAEDKAELIVEALEPSVQDAWNLDAPSLAALFALPADRIRNALRDGGKGDPAPAGRTAGEAPQGAAAGIPPPGSGKSSRASESPDPAGSSRAGLAVIRVSTEKLDGLMNLVSELIIAKERLVESCDAGRNPDLESVVEKISMLADGLHEKTMDIRMVPVGTLFNKFRRLVRDLAQREGKEIMLTMEGAETELDKTLIEELDEPFVHMIRNAVDHGIEPPAERTARGKPACGTVHLSARPSGSEVLFEIRDDGRGIRLEAVSRRAVEKGLLRSGAEAAPKQLLQLLFLPGFSTSDHVTQISGRGVGMDAAKQGIEKLRGSLELESDEGAGTRIRIRLPLNLGVIDGLHVTLDGLSFVMPNPVVLEVAALAAPDSGGDRWMPLRGELIPMVSLREHFGISGPPPAVQYAVIVRIQDRKAGFLVDGVQGGVQVVLKPLGSLYKRQQTVLGACILGCGTLALVLDLPRLVRQAERESMAGPAHASGSPAFDFNQ